MVDLAAQNATNPRNLLISKQVIHHPARFPQVLPEFFINFLTNPGDLILDPFGGLNVTGAAAEALGRQWISVELDPLYLKASRFRIENVVLPAETRLPNSV